ncbi:MAG TPA: type II toxin-antitoxin system RelE/ParE family toxin [Coriobacteriia bacterium]
MDSPPSAARELEALPRETRDRVADAIEALADQPRPSGAKLLAGTGRERIWRISVGQYRVLYQVTDVRATVASVQVADRREAYDATAIRRLLGRLRGGPRFGDAAAG